MRAFIVAVLAACACGGSPTQPDRVPSGRAFDLRVGDSALTTDDVRIQPGDYVATLVVGTQ